MIDVGQGFVRHFDAAEGEAVELGERLQVVCVEVHVAELQVLQVLACGGISSISE